MKIEVLCNRLRCTRNYHGRCDKKNGITLTAQGLCSAAVASELKSLQSAKYIKK